MIRTLKSFILLSFYFLVYFAVQSVHAGPRLECDAPTYDFGTVIGQESITHEFMLKNSGDEPVVISSIKNCCGVESVVEPMTIPAGSNAVCTSVFTTRNRNGPQDKQILLATNMRRRPYFELKMIGMLLRPIEVSPRYLRLGKIVPGAEISPIITATNILQEPVVLGSVESTVPDIHAEVVSPESALPTNSVRRSWTIRLKSSDAMKPGKLNGQVRLNFSTGSVSVPVLGEVCPLIQVVPKQITIGSSSSETVNRLIMLRSADGMPFDVESAELQEIDGEVEVQHISAGQWRVKVGVQPATAKENAIVRIKTAEPRHSVHEVLIQFIGLAEAE